MEITLSRQIAPHTQTLFSLQYYQVSQYIRQKIFKETYIFKDPVKTNDQMQIHIS